MGPFPTTISEGETHGFKPKKLRNSGECSLPPLLSRLLETFSPLQDLVRSLNPLIASLCAYVRRGQRTS